MNGAVETRSNWKGLNAGLREVPSMAAMSFAVVGEGEDVRNTRGRAWKSDDDESHSLPFACPRNVTVTGNDLRVEGTAETGAKTSERLRLCAKPLGHVGALSVFIPNSYTELV